MPQLRTREGRILDNQTIDPFRASDWRSQAPGAAGLYGELPALPTRGPVRASGVREPEHTAAATGRGVTPGLRG